MNNLPYEVYRNDQLVAAFAKYDHAEHLLEYLHSECWGSDEDVKLELTNDCAVERTLTRKGWRR